MVLFLTIENEEQIINLQVCGVSRSTSNVEIWLINLSVTAFVDQLAICTSTYTSRDVNIYFWQTTYRLLKSGFKLIITLHWPS